ncbi:MAG: DUF1648 domain-containing protein [Candidatus Binataceae bacterium]
MRFLPAVEIPQIAIVALMFAIAIIGWSSAPARIAVHFGAGGQVNRYGGKVEGLLLIPLIASVIYVGGYLIQDLVAGNPQVLSSYILFRFAYLITLAAAYAAIQLYARGFKVSVGSIVLPVVALDMLATVNFVWHAIAASRAG